MEKTRLIVAIKQDDVDYVVSVADQLNDCFKALLVVGAYTARALNILIYTLDAGLFGFSVVELFDNLEDITFFHQLGINLDEDDVLSAVRRGNLDIVQYLILSGCQYYSDILVEALLAEQFSTFDWLLTMNVEWNEDAYKLIKYAKPSIVEKAHNHGCPGFHNSNYCIICTVYIIDNLYLDYDGSMKSFIDWLPKELIVMQTELLWSSLS